MTVQDCTTCKYVDVSMNKGEGPCHKCLEYLFNSGIYALWKKEKTAKTHEAECCGTCRYWTRKPPGQGGACSYMNQYLSSYMTCDEWKTEDSAAPVIFCPWCGGGHVVKKFGGTWRHECPECQSSFYVGRIK